MLRLGGSEGGGVFMCLWGGLGCLALLPGQELQPWDNAFFSGSPHTFLLLVSSYFFTSKLNPQCPDRSFHLLELVGPLGELLVSPLNGGRVRGPTPKPLGYCSWGEEASLTGLLEELRPARDTAWPRCNKTSLAPLLPPARDHTWGYHG